MAHVDNMNWHKAEELGITKYSLTEKQLNALNYGNKTSVILSKGKSYKLSSFFSADGKPFLRIHEPVKKIDLDAPFLGYSFSDDQKKTLMETGSLGEIIPLNLKTKTIDGLVSLDRELGTLEFVPKNYVRVSDETISKFNLIESQIEELKKGKAITIVYNNKEENVELNLQFNSAKKTFELFKEPIPVSLIRNGQKYSDRQIESMLSKFVPYDFEKYKEEHQMNINLICEGKKSMPMPLKSLTTKDNFLVGLKLRDENKLAFDFSFRSTEFIVKDVYKYMDGEIVLNKEEKQELENKGYISHLVDCVKADGKRTKVLMEIDFDFNNVAILPEGRLDVFKYYDKQPLSYEHKQALKSGKSININDKEIRIRPSKYAIDYIPSIPAKELLEVKAKKYNVILENFAKAVEKESNFIETPEMNKEQNHMKSQIKNVKKQKKITI